MGMALRGYWITLLVLLMIVVIDCCAGKGHNTTRKLKCSTVFWNSGAHSYDYTYAKDPYHNMKIWRYGRGELTNMGVNQTFRLGQFIRLRYSGLLDPAIKNAVLVKSTDDDKTVASALAVMAGIYPVTLSDTWNSTATTWRPISIRTSSPNDNDYLSLPVTGNSEYIELMSDIFSSKWMKEYEAVNSDFFHNATIVTGVFWGMWNIHKLANNIFSLNIHGYPLLKFWDVPGSLEKLKEMYSISLGSLFTDISGNYTIPVSKLQGGVLLNQIVESMQNKTRHDKHMPVMTGYSVPTTTLVGLLVTLGNYDWKAPEPASLLMFDLYEYNNATLKIEISYKNGDGPIKLLKVYDCKTTCPFEQFVKIASNFIASDTEDGDSDISGSGSGNDIQGDSFSTCDGLLLGFIATLFVMSFVAIGIVLYLLGRPVAPSPNPAEFERIE